MNIFIKKTHSEKFSSLTIYYNYYYNLSCNLYLLSGYGVPI